MKSEIKTQNISTKKLKFVAEIFLADLRMDIKMPVMDGVETFKKIKKIRSDAVVMIMTAYSVDDLVQEVMQEGVYDIIYKPLDINKVVGIIEELSKK